MKKMEAEISDSKTTKTEVRFLRTITFAVHFVLQWPNYDI